MGWMVNRHGSAMISTEARLLRPVQSNLISISQPPTDRHPLLPRHHLLLARAAWQGPHRLCTPAHAHARDWRGAPAHPQHESRQQRHEQRPHRPPPPPLPQTLVCGKGHFAVTGLLSHRQARIHFITHKKKTIKSKGLQQSTRRQLHAARHPVHGGRRLAHALLL